MSKEKEEMNSNGPAGNVLDDIAADIMKERYHRIRIRTGYVFLWAQLGLVAYYVGKTGRVFGLGSYSGLVLLICPLVSLLSSTYLRRRALKVRE